MKALNGFLMIQKQMTLKIFENFMATYVAW